MDCKMCGKILSTPQTLRNHMLLHKNKDERPFKCSEPDCRVSFSAVGDLNRHLRNTHSKFLLKLPCRISRCNHISASKKLMKQHIEEHHNPADAPNFIVCSLCPFQTTKTLYLTRHIKIVHLKEREHSCRHDNCQFRATTSCNLTKHERSHLKEEERRFPCSHSGCTKRFNQKGTLRIHERVHTQEKNYPCSLCEYRGGSSGNLKMHMTTHTKERGLHCKLCDFSTPSYGDLNQHIRRIHLKEKPFHCQETNCEATFVTKSELQSHMAIHTGEKNYKCKKCDRAFSCAQNLSRHLRNVHRPEGVKPKTKCPFSTSGCSYRCDANGTMKHHVQSRHSNERPFSCELCDYTCKLKSNLRIHRNQVHQKKTKIKRKQKYEQSMQRCTSCRFSTKDGAKLAGHFSTAHQLPKVYLERIHD